MTDVPADTDFTTAVELTLRGGRRVTLRAIRPDDADALQAAVRRLSRESRYTRFMSSMNELPPSLLDKAVNPVAGRDLALVALAGPAAGSAEVEVVGGARYIADPAHRTCEFALAVGEDWRGTGLSSSMLKRLIESARARGLETMEGVVLANNTPMRNLATRLGFQVTPSSEGPGVVRVCLDLNAGQAPARTTAESS